MMAVTMTSKNDALEPGPPKLLFEGRFATAQGTPRDTWYDVEPDGRFIMLKPSKMSPPARW